MQSEISLISINHRGQLYFLEFSNGYTVRATKKTIDDLDLVEGLTFDETIFSQLREILDRKFAFYTAESMLARRGFSIGEFKERLRRKEIGKGLIVEIIAKYTSEQVLDDYQYGLIKARSLLARKPAGRGFIISYLQNRLIPRSIAEGVAAEVLEGSDETTMALKLLEKKRLTLAKFDLETARRKAYTYLSRRAISYGAAKEAFSHLFEKEPD